MKKIGLFLAMMIVFSGITFANGNNESGSAVKAKVGMVTDSGSIDDKSFNQGTWEGLLRAGEELDVQTKYLKPVGTTEADYNADYSVFNTADNTVSIFFAEHEAAFLAGIAAALQLQEGAMGFIGGMEIPPVQKFNWGFQQGIAYANANLGTAITLDPENIIYQGTFSDVAAGQQLAAQMYDKGVTAIFCAAGGVGVGAISEAKNRATTGENVWIVGVDVDQYFEGIYGDNKSIILTSAMKRIDNAAFDMVKANLEGKFPGGETLMFNAANNGVGIPELNPNLDDSVVAKVMDIYKELQTGSIVVAAEQGDLVK
ncbi:MAG: BMP family ABC transporter substrate-binding protein [Spirochaetaceae bacterium 4572_7]|nr:MAG: BMP family ABC transporter substrate-binding protein [Spirochaetaceae bacterium 4572_7]